MPESRPRAPASSDGRPSIYGYAETGPDSRLLRLGPDQDDQGSEEHGTFEFITWRILTMPFCITPSSALYVTQALLSSGSTSSFPIASTVSNSLPRAPIMQYPVIYESITKSMPRRGKQPPTPLYPESVLLRPRDHWRRWLAAALTSGLLMLTLWIPNSFKYNTEPKFNVGHITSNEPKAEQVVRRYNVTIGARWMNLGQSSKATRAMEQSPSGANLFEQMEGIGEAYLCAMGRRRAQPFTPKKET
ncbi:uncharacterized protein PG986_005748 [Apiospora aurea]|uniref:Uncharacterized protein n=1 Tax=Apiospora aurea TaxID=335848 RepID=A0ABR1QIF8_9PEZI